MGDRMTRALILAALLALPDTAQEAPACGC